VKITSARKLYTLSANKPNKFMKKCCTLLNYIHCSD